MSEFIGMDIAIGGKIREDIIEELLERVRDDISEFTGPNTVKDFKSAAKKGRVSWCGSSNYGECDELKAFLMEHDIAYSHHCDAKYEYDASVEFWQSGMEDPITLDSNQGGNNYVNAEVIRPVLDILVSYVARGKTALPLFIGDEKLKSLDDDAGPQLLEACIKNPRLTVKKCVAYLDEHVVVERDLPPIEIIKV